MIKLNSTMKRSLATFGRYRAQRCDYRYDASTKTVHKIDVKGVVVEDRKVDLSIWEDDEVADRHNCSYAYDEDGDRIEIDDDFMDDGSYTF